MVMQNKLVIIGLGSNQNSLKNLRKALVQIRRQPQFNILKVSRIYESEAQLPESAPESWKKDYLNAAVLVEVENFEALNLLKKLKDIEKDLGRAPAERWAPREIDLDILFVEDYSFQQTDLIIPHSFLFDRPFAWRPAREVWPLVPEGKNFSQFNTRVSERYCWPEIVAILNVTPDSFSDGGKFDQKENFLNQTRQQIQAGADYLDIGAESTRPGAQPLSSLEEIRRLELAFEWLEELKKEKLPQFKVSLDSRHYDSIKHIIQKYPVNLINDVSGLQDIRILNLTQKNNLQAVCMHSLSVPADKNKTLSVAENPILQLKKWWSQKENQWRDMDLSIDFTTENIFFDPGFGFGKTTDQSQYLFDHLPQLKSIQQNFFLGYSRKSFLTKPTEQMTRQLNVAFCQFLRVHDVAAQKKALNGL